jgi:hypothetical protein
MKYVPKPIETSGVSLPAPLLALMEKLAENAHEVWAATRVEQGWTHGPKRDDENKRHPCLVPYQDLPESEKEYDRRVAGETLKTILTLGYRIMPPGKEA